jgi:hypothetical protein
MKNGPEQGDPSGWLLGLVIGIMVLLFVAWIVARSV